MPGLGLLAVYGLAVACASIAIASSAGWACVVVLPAVIVAYHFGYGIGSLLGWIDVLRGAPAGRGRFARLTR